jgi:multidrug efflux system membrane fusion protein
MPGLFVRVRMPLGKPQQSVLIAEQAVGTDQGQKYVYVVNREPADDKTKDEGKALAEDEGVVQYRRVTLGQLQDDGLQVITSGLAPTDRIIVSGLQIVHPKMTVKIDETPMPTNQQPDSSAETDTTTQATEPAGG